MIGREAVAAFAGVEMTRMWVMSVRWVQILGKVPHTSAVDQDGVFSPPHTVRTAVVASGTNLDAEHVAGRGGSVC